MRSLILSIVILATFAHLVVSVAIDWQSCTFEEAEQGCKSFGYTLPNPTTLEHNEVLLKAMRLYKLKSAWIGVQGDRVSYNKYEWKKVKNGRILEENELHWAVYEPTYDQQSPMLCVEALDEDAKANWNDIRCDKLSGLLCERELGNFTMI